MSSLNKPAKGVPSEARSDGTVHMVVPLHVTLRLGDIAKGIDLDLLPSGEGIDE